MSDPVTLTYDDVHEAIDFIGDVFKKYHHLLTASSYASLVPILHPSWTAVFGQPWMPQPPRPASRPL